MGPRALVSSQNELGCLDPPHPVSSLAHDRGTTVHDTSPHTCVRPEHPFYGAGVTPFPWFWRECRHIHFGRALLGGVRRANPPRSSRPSSLLRGERARCSESNAAIDESKRALTSSPMRPVRPGGTSTTDSSCPSAHSLRTFEWTAPWRRLKVAHCGWVTTVRMTPSSAATRPTSSPKSCPNDGRSIRPPGNSPHLSTKTDLQRRGAGSPLFTLFACWTEKVRSRHRS